VSRLPRSVHHQGFRQHNRHHCIREGSGAESAMEPMPMPSRGPKHVPSHEDVAERANQSGNAVPRDEVGVIDSVRASGGPAQGSVASRGFSESGDCPDPTCMRPPSGSSRNSVRSDSQL
jgi:hypothetical protein